MKAFQDLLLFPYRRRNKRSQLHINDKRRNEVGLPDGSQASGQKAEFGRQRHHRRVGWPVAFREIQMSLSKGTRIDLLQLPPLPLFTGDS